MARVSSDEQAKGYSLDVQEEALIRHCKREGIEVLKMYREDHSAKDFNRPEFIKIMEYAKANKNRVDYLLFTSWDRFSRNITDALVVLRKLNKLGVEPRAIEQPLDLSIPESKAMLAIYLAIPEIDNDRRSIKIRGGVRAALKAGRWCRMAPRGYKNSRDSENKPLLIPSKDAETVKSIFKGIAHGKSQMQMIQEAKEEGLVISKNAMSKMLVNPMYMGKIVVPAQDDEGEQVINGVHEGLISEELFLKVQDILLNRRMQRRLPRWHATTSEFVLRGHLDCVSCGSKLTGSWSRSKTGKRYAYYHCNNCGQQRVRTDKANELVSDLFEGMIFKKGAKALYQAILQELYGNDQTKNRKQIEKLEKEVVAIDGRLVKLQDMLMDGQITPSDYTQMKARCEATRESVMTKLQQKQDGNSKMIGRLKTGTNFLANIHRAYNKASTQGKQLIIGSIFPENLVLDQNKCRTPRVNEVLRLLLFIDNGSGQNKKGQLLPKLELSPWVETMGVEPTTS